MDYKHLHRLDFHAISKTGHWCPYSQDYAGAHNLLWALDQGWQLGPEARRVDYPTSTPCSVAVFYFTLHRDRNQMVMPVIDTPYLVRLIAEHGLDVKSTDVEERLLRRSA